MRGAAFLLPAVFLTAVFTQTAGAEVSVRLSLDREEATMADALRLTVSIEGKQGTDQRPVIKGLENFTVAAGGTSSRVSIVNGRKSTGKDYIFHLQPKKTGRHRIGPAEVRIKGVVHVSNTATVSVVETAAPTGDGGDPIFLRASLQRNRLYAGEQTLYTLRLYRQARVSDISVDLPESKVLLIRQFGNPREYSGVFEGRSYNILEVRYTLQPQRPGSYALEPSRMHMKLHQPHRRSRRSLFDDMFSGTGRPFSVASEALELDVLSPPEEGRPPDFSGLVGTFGIAAVLDPRSVGTGQSSTLTVTVSGRGNVKRIPDLKVPEVDGLKVYADEPTLEVGQDQEGLQGAKTMKWALVPETEGTYEIPPLEVSFFDTRKEQYRSVRTPLLGLEATPGESRAVATPPVAPSGEGKAPVAPMAVREIGRDILPVHTSVKDLAPRVPGVPRGALLWLILAAPTGFFLVVLGGVRLRRKSPGALAALRSRRAAREFSRSCSGEAMRPERLVVNFQHYLNDRFGLSLGALTPEEAEMILRGRGVSEETASRVRDSLRLLEDTVYTGSDREAAAEKESIARLIRRIEKESR